MNLLTRMLCLLAFVLSAFGSVSAGVRYLVLTENDGTVVQFALADRPVVTLDGQELTVVTPTQSVTVGLADVKHYKFTDEATGLAEVRSAGRPAFAEGRATFGGLRAGSRVVVLTADGRVVASVAAAADGSASVDLSRYGAGVYVVRTAAGSYKVQL